MTTRPLPAVCLLLVLIALPAEASRPITARLANGDRIEWRRGDAPELLALPSGGEGWLALATRLTGSAVNAARLREENDRLARPLRDVRVRVPWDLLAAGIRLQVLQALFPADRAIADGWQHVILAPWGGDGESWWEMAEWWCGDGRRYRALREANPEVGLYPRRGDRVLIPTDLLAPDLRDRLPAQVAAAPAPTATPAPPPPAPTRAALARTQAASDGDLEYLGDHAVYRLKPGEALYSAVVVRFTGLLHAADVNATALKIATGSGIRDVTAIPVGFPVRIPLDLLLPEHLPAGHPRRREWEHEQTELAAIRRVIRAANLDGIHVVLDAGHGGADTGAIVDGVWESTYAYDVMTRLKRVLQRETRATVWTTVQDPSNGTPSENDLLPAGRSHRLLVNPHYDLRDSSVGVNLRWVLTNSILARLERQKVDAERVVFVSIHADSLHPSVRGLMVYVPSRNLRAARGPSPAAFFDCEEARGLERPRFPSGFRARSEALSTQLGEAIVRSAQRASLPVHPFQPVRSSVLRSGSRWVPAVLKYSRVPTSVLVELCNLNNEDDRAALLTWRYREKLAHAIAAGLAEAFSR